MNTGKQRLRLLGYIATKSLQHAYQLIKELIKVLIGRERYHDERVKFWRLGLYLLHLMGIRRIRALTCAIDDLYEGPGSQAFLMMSTISFARANGLTYLHTPLSKIGHADRPMQEWAAAWEAAFNLGSGELPCLPKCRGVISYGYFVSGLDECFGWFGQKQELIACFKALLPEFRRKYYANKSIRANHQIVVAVHIRRGDVSASEHADMYTSSDKITRIVETIKSTLASREVPFSLRVYSEGSPSDFEELASLGAEFFLNADPIWTMRELIEADILVMAKSHFSYYAGVISDGIKIFEPCSMSRTGGEFPGHPPIWGWALFEDLDGWLACQDDGSVDRAAFEHELQLLLQTRNRTGTSKLVLSNE